MAKQFLTPYIYPLNTVDWNTRASILASRWQELAAAQNRLFRDAGERITGFVAFPHFEPEDDTLWSEVNVAGEPGFEAWKPIIHPTRPNHDGDFMLTIAAWGEGCEVRVRLYHADDLDSIVSQYSMQLGTSYGLYTKSVRISNSTAFDSSNGFINDDQIPLFLEFEARATTHTTNEMHQVELYGKYLNDEEVGYVPTYHFTTAGNDGRTGPSASNVNNEYDGTLLGDAVSVLGDGVQVWDVPTTSTYRIAARGAGFGSDNFQRGAQMVGELDLNAGTTLRILCGQNGTNVRCGAGGSFVVCELNEADDALDPDNVFNETETSVTFEIDMLFDGRDGTATASDTWEDDGGLDFTDLETIDGRLFVDGEDPNGYEIDTFNNGSITLTSGVFGSSVSSTYHVRLEGVGDIESLARFWTDEVVSFDDFADDLIGLEITIRTSNNGGDYEIERVDDQYLYTSGAPWAMEMWDGQEVYPLVVAGGAGGFVSGEDPDEEVGGGVDEDGQDSSGGDGGTDGEGGGQGGSAFAQSGAGYLGDGTDGDDIGAEAFIEGGVGALAGDDEEGGFGGGGTGRLSTNYRLGGGGGFSGGASSGNDVDDYGGGGGSYSVLEEQNNDAAAHDGDGEVIFQQI